MNEITAKVDKLICGILDLAYEEPDHANEFIFGLISKLCIYSVFYAATYQMRKGINKSFESIEKKALISEVPGKIDYDKILNDIIQGKKK